MNVIFVSGSDHLYFPAWFYLYKTIIHNIPNSKIYFFDLGLEEDDIKIVKSLNVTYKLFDFNKYPDWVNIKVACGQWAWKAQCIKEIMELYPICKDNNQYLIWCDSRNIIRNNLNQIFDFINTNGIYTNTTGGNVERWTVKETIDYLNADKYKMLPMRNAALPCFNINISWVRDFINDYSKLSLIKECIFPNGSSRDNHRQDQSVLTILFYKYKDLYNFDSRDFNGGIDIHSNMVRIVKRYNN